MIHKSRIFILLIFLLISSILLFADDDAKKSSFEQLLFDMNTEKVDTSEQEQSIDEWPQLATQQLKEPTKLMVTFAGGYLVPYGTNIKNAYSNGYGGNLQLKLSNIYTLLGFRHHIGIEGGYYLNEGIDRSNLTTYLANLIISTDLKKNTKLIFGYEFGGGYYLQELKTAFNGTTTAKDLGAKVGIKLGYKITNNFDFTLKGGGIYISNDFDTGNTQEYLIGNIDISYIF